MVQIFAQDPNTNPYIMVDPFNEPDYFNMRWETQNGVVGAADRYIAVYDSIHNVNPDVMLVFEGLGQVTLALAVIFFCRLFPFGVMLQLAAVDCLCPA